MPILPILLAVVTLTNGAPCPIFCEGVLRSQVHHLIILPGPILEAVQLLAVFNDSKTFVDMPLRTDPDIALVGHLVSVS